MLCAKFREMSGLHLVLQLSDSESCNLTPAQTGSAGPADRTQAAASASVSASVATALQQQPPSHERRSGPGCSGRRERRGRYTFAASRRCAGPECRRPREERRRPRVSADRGCHGEPERRWSLPGGGGARTPPSPLPAAGALLIDRLRFIHTKMQDLCLSCS